ncbi:MAG: cyclic pyranopterin monophosphate synthase MoaC, partial [Gemmatimonadetes bacterium]|nr:cyclic pyranopterin monophosphate synthase MoaC [Gemmatimonadota bacterium]
MEEKRLSHIGDDERARMVDVSPKDETVRSARAEAVVRVGAEVAALLRSTGAVAKGNVIETARIAGIMAAKRTSELVPMCHPLILDHIAIDGELGDDRVTLECEVRCT